MSTDLEQQAALRTRELYHMRRQVIAMEPGRGLAAILEAPHPAALVHSFPEQEFYLLVNEIGHSDALELISLASSRQLEYFLDVDAWEKDRFDHQAVTRWLSLFMKASPARLFRWLVSEKTGFIELYLRGNIDLVTREHDQDPSDFGTEFFTYDDMLYIRLRPQPEDADTDGAEEQERLAVLRQFLDRLAAIDHPLMVRLLTEVAALMPSEQEENLFRMRSVRMAEKGFLPFDEAVGIYQPLTAAEMDPGEWQAPRPSEPGAAYSVALYPSGMIDKGTPFALALSQIDDEDAVRDLQEQFAALCNRLISADMVRVGGFDDLKEVVGKAAGYISIGLECGEEGAGILRSMPLQLLFRRGYQTVLALKWKARRFLDKAWFQSQGLPLRFWGESGMGILGGLLLKKPLCFDPHGGNRLYREFTTAEEVGKAAAAFGDIVALDGLLADMQIGIDESVRGVLDYRNLLLTLWAGETLSPGSGFVPLSLEQVKTVMERLFSGTPVQDPVAGTRRSIGDDMKNAFLQWAARAGRRDAVDLSKRFSAIFENLFSVVEMEYGTVKTDDLDPRFILHFVMSDEYAQPGDEDV